MTISGTDVYLPNPFEYLFDEQLTGAVATAHRRVRPERSWKHLDEERRRACQALVDSASVAAASIVSEAEARADAMVAEAATKRAAAISLIERSTRGVEELLKVTAAKADLIRLEAERVRADTERARRSNQPAPVTRTIDLRTEPRPSASGSACHQPSSGRSGRPSGASELGGVVVADELGREPDHLEDGLHLGRDRPEHQDGSVGLQLGLLQQQA